MNILQDIKEILIKNKDKEHHLKIECSWDGIEVYLDCDSNKGLKEDSIIPIYYCTLDEFAYIPNDG